MSLWIRQIIVTCLPVQIWTFWSVARGILGLRNQAKHLVFCRIIQELFLVMLVMIHDDSTATKAALLVRIAPPLFTYVALYLGYTHMSRWTLIKRSDIVTCLLPLVAFFDKTLFGKFYLCKQNTGAFIRKMFNDLTRRLQTPTQTFKGVKRK